jgi:hypothetical protein
VVVATDLSLEYGFAKALRAYRLSNIIRNWSKHTGCTCMAGSAESVPTNNCYYCLEIIPLVLLLVLVQNRYTCSNSDYSTCTNEICQTSTILKQIKMYTSLTFLHEPKLHISSEPPWPPAYIQDAMARLTSLYAELSAVGHCGTRSAARASDKSGVT